MGKIVNLDKAEQKDDVMKFEDHTFRLVQELGELHRWFDSENPNIVTFPSRGSVPAPDGQVRLLTLAFNRHLQDLQKYIKRVEQQLELFEEHKNRSSKHAH
ncbi:MAG: hypothetical protein KDD66_11665 [Bdellovibrionales bacterium]|nr:hypothetical protein [Bdellovibrionales bacterium]